jgi:protein-S-isoprenylcysteine O-methyltransferase Ste14
MHLAYTLGVRTVAIFLKSNFDHWAPPSSITRVLYNSSGCSAEEVVSACLEEVAPREPTTPNLSAKRLNEGAPLASIPMVDQVIGRLERLVHLKKLLFTSRIAQSLFLVSLGVYSFLLPPSGILDEGTWGETLLDMVEIGIPLLGCVLRLWAVSHNQTATRLAPFPPALITTGPYALIRYPMFVANVLIGFGMIMVFESFLLIPVFLALLVLHVTLVIPSEEQYLQEKFGIAFTHYRYSVLRFIPTALPKNAFSWPSGLPFKEAALAAAIIMIVFLAEWFESPYNGRWIMTAVQSVLS